LKPLTNIDEFLKRFDNFKGGEVRSIEITSPSLMTITLVGQDEARAFDWISVQLECSGISDAQILDNSKLVHLDMNEGISILNTNHSLAFAVGECYNRSSIKSSSCFIECSNMKYEEGLF
jgi:hypothetical protein